MTTLEIEFKTLLTQNHYEQLLPLFDNPPVHQINYYFDTPDFALKAHHMALRVRAFTDRAELTLKVKQAIGNLEYTLDFQPDEADQFLNHLDFPDCPAKQLLITKGIAIDQLQLLGKLETTRYEKRASFGLLALDVSHYGHITDYELEVEVSDPDSGHIAFQDFLKHHHITYHPAKSKIARFCDAILPPNSSH